MKDQTFYEDQVSEAKAWRRALPEDLRTMTPRTQAMHDAFAPEFTPEYCYQAMLDFARQIELELNSANDRIRELSRKSLPHECPQESVTLLAANHPNLAEYLASLESRLASITDHYNILRADLVEREARDLYGGFQAAACYKDINTCRTIANARLRGKCLECEGRGEVGGQFPDGSYQTDRCQHCEGNGFVEIPDLAWLKNGKIQFNMLPKEHPDYDPTIE